MSISITNNKNIDFNDWYREVITKGNLIEYSNIKGCYILLNNTIEMWEKIKNYLNREFKKRKVEQVYYPLFVTKENLQKEKSHVQGFEAEVMWIEKSNLAIRPTSECIICPNISNKIRSHNDLPKKINQWCNVVRSEFKDTTPFIRSREFLWQEGHSFHKNEKEASAEVTDMINVYEKIYRELLAVPTIIGIKTKSETFAGADYTLTIEGYIPDANKGIQCATSHFLGTKFPKMFDIEFTGSDMIKSNCFYNSYGFTTRSLGVMIQTHSDNKGLVLPPKIAPLQLIIIPIYKKSNYSKIVSYALEAKKLLEAHFSVDVDISDNKPGYKYNKYELEGVPIRIEIGEKEVDNKTYTVVRRDIMTKQSISNLNFIINIVNNMQNDMYSKAKNNLLNSITFVNSISDITGTTNVFLCKFCGNEECEKNIKEKFGVKSLCIPQDDKLVDLIDKNKNGSDTCVFCDNKLGYICLFGKSY